MQDTELFVATIEQVITLLTSGWQHVYSLVTILISIIFTYPHLTLLTMNWLPIDTVRNHTELCFASLFINSFFEVSFKRLLRYLLNPFDFLLGLLLWFLLRFTYLFIYVICSSHIGMRFLWSHVIHDFYYLFGWSATQGTVVTSGWLMHRTYILVTLISRLLYLTDIHGWTFISTPFHGQT